MPEGKTPKLTAIQREIIQKMAAGWKLHYVACIRTSPSAFLSGANTGDYFKVRIDNFYRLKDRGFVKMCSDTRWAWRSSEYMLTESGQAALAAAGKGD